MAELQVRWSRNEFTVAPGARMLAPEAMVAALPGATIMLDGVRLPSSVSSRARRGLLVLGGFAVASDVSIRDHLRSVSSAPDEVLADLPLLAGRGSDPAGWLSGGERQILGWAMTVARRPRALVLDGAGRGMDPLVLDWAGGQLDALSASDTAVVVRPGRDEERRWIGDS